MADRVELRTYRLALLLRFSEDSGEAAASGDVEPPELGIRGAVSLDEEDHGA